jgi:transposase
MEYDHYIGLDWAKANMAIARMTKHSNEIQTVDVRTDLDDLKVYLDNLKGTKILTFEESNPAQWLFTELRPLVDEILVCDPYRNHLLKEGGKSDRVDAQKLVRLLKAGLLKPVFHCTDEFIHLRKLISGYQDLVQMGVRQKNQRTALFNAIGRSKKEKNLPKESEAFVLEGLDAGIEFYETQKLRYEKQLKKIINEHRHLKNLTTIPGIGVIGAITIASIVVEPKRFADRSAFWSYCGLIRLEKMSGGRSYGQKVPRHSRRLKLVFKTAAVSCMANQKETNPLYVYYRDLIIKKNYPEHQARHALSRRIATLAFGILKSNKPLQAKELFEKSIEVKN